MKQQIRNIHFSVADLSEFKGGRLGLGRRHAASYEVRAVFPLVLETLFAHTFPDYKSQTSSTHVRARARAKFIGYRV